MDQGNEGGRQAGSSTKIVVIVEVGRDKEKKEKRIPFTNKKTEENRKPQVCEFIILVNISSIVDNYVI